MSLVLIRQTAPTDTWVAALADACPGLAVHVWPETGPVEDVEFVLTWAAGPGVIARFPNLRAIFSLGAGVDHVLEDPTVPKHLPVIRMLDPSLTHGVVQYLLMAVLREHRRLAEMERNQRDGVWSRLLPAPCRIGIMGLGELGRAFAAMAVALGYDVAGWSRGPKAIDGVQCYAGQEQLTPFLNRTDMLVCLLPRTADTEGILNMGTFERLPRGACLINAGRGEHLVEEDLLAALDSGALSSATLDVFRIEPLPREHPFWRRPDILVTPHIGGMTVPATAARHVADGILKIRKGERPAGLVDRRLGY